MTGLPEKEEKIVDTPLLNKLNKIKQHQYYINRFRM